MPIWEIQQTLNKLLYSFLTPTSLPWWGVLFYPFLNGCTRFKRFSGLVKTLKESAEKLNWVEMVRLCDRYLSKKGTKILAEVICEGYQYFENNVQIGILPFELTAPEKFNENSEKETILIKRLGKLEKYIKNTFTDELILMVVHESFAKGDYVPGYSDCDLFAIIHNKVFSSKKSLINLRKKMIKVSSYLYSINPLQHHGVLVCTESDLQSYPLNFIPPFLIRQGKTLFSCNVILNGFLNQSKEIIYWELNARLDRTNIYLKSIPKNDMHSFKSLLDNIKMLLVEFYELIDGVGIEKSAAIERFQNEFPEHRELLSSMTLIRSNWPEHNNIASEWFVKLFKMNPELIRLSYRIWNRKIQSWIFKELGENWETKMLMLLNTIKKEITIYDSKS